jgi:hypothetical protein
MEIRALDLKPDPILREEEVSLPIGRIRSSDILQEAPVDRVLLRGVLEVDPTPNELGHHHLLGDRALHEEVGIIELGLEIPDPPSFGGKRTTVTRPTNVGPRH